MKNDSVFELSKKVKARLKEYNDNARALYGNKLSNKLPLWGCLWGMTFFGSSGVALIWKTGNIQDGIYDLILGVSIFVQSRILCKIIAVCQ